jgi:hypothetical protein
MEVSTFAMRSGRALTVTAKAATIEGIVEGCNGLQALRSGSGFDAPFMDTESGIL